MNSTPLPVLKWVRFQAWFLLWVESGPPKTYVEEPLEVIEQKNITQPAASKVYSDSFIENRLQGCRGIRAMAHEGHHAGTP